MDSISEGIDSGYLFPVSKGKLMEQKVGASVQEAIDVKKTEVRILLSQRKWST